MNMDFRRVLDVGMVLVSYAFGLGSLVAIAGAVTVSAMNGWKSVEISFTELGEQTFELAAMHLALVAGGWGLRWLVIDALPEGGSA